MKLSATLADKFATDAGFRERMLETHVEGYLKDQPDLPLYLEAKYNMTLEDYFVEAKYIMSFGMQDAKVFLVRETAQEIARKINIKEEKHFDYLSRVPQGDFVFILSKDSFIKFFRVDTRFVVLAIEGSHTHVNYCMFNFIIDRDYEQIGDDDMSKRYAMLFLQLCVFWQFTEPETIVLPAGRKQGTRRDGKLTNDSGYGITIMDSTWNKVVVRPDGFDVNGHLRVQPCGKGRKDRKLIWIEPFRKNGYVRRTGN